jgi:hypothetical protein
MADQLERVYRITADATQAINQLDKIAKSTGNIDSSMGKLGSVLKGAFAGAVAIGAVTSLGSAFKKSSASMDEMVKSAQKVGVATESLSRLKYVADQSGVSFDGLQTGLKKLNKNLADVETGTTSAAKALRSLGVNGGDSPEDSLSKIAEAFASVPDSAQKTALAMDIFGKSGADLIPILNAGADGIKNLSDRAERLGLVIDENTAKAAEKFNDSISDIDAGLGAIAKKITAGAMPAFSQLASTIADSIVISGEWKQVGKSLGYAVLWVSDKFIKATATVYAFGSGISAVASAVSELASGNFKDAGKVLEQWVDGVNALDRSTAEISSKLAGMGESSDAVKNSFDKNSDSAKKFANAAGDLKTELSGTKTALDELRKVGSDRIAAFESIKTLESLSPESIERLGVTINDVSDAIKKLNETADPADASLRKFSEDTQNATNPFNELARTMNNLDMALQKGYISWETYEKAMDSALEKVKPENIEKTKEALDEVGVAVGNTLSSGVSGLIDVFVKADQTFNQFASNFLQQIGKMIIQTLILAQIKSSLKGTSFGSAFGFANGGAFNGSTGLPQGVYSEPTFFKMPGSGLAKFAHGGVPGMGVLAEAGRSEAIVPLIRHGADLGVKASPVNVTVNNNMSETASVQVQETNKPDGSKEISVMIERRVKEMFANGSMDKSMRGAYGLSRAPT